MSTVQQRFEEVVAKIKALPGDGPVQPSNEMKLKMYSLFRQAKDGDAKGPKPSMFDLVGRFKYESWSQLKGMDREEAMLKYVAAAEEFAREQGASL